MFILLFIGFLLGVLCYPGVELLICKLVGKRRSAVSGGRVAISPTYMQQQILKESMLKCTQLGWANAILQRYFTELAGSYAYRDRLVRSILAKAKKAKNFVSLEIQQIDVGLEAPKLLCCRCVSENAVAKFMKLRVSHAVTYTLTADAAIVTVKSPFRAFPEAGGGLKKATDDREHIVDENTHSWNPNNAWRYFSSIKNDKKHLDIASNSNSKSHEAGSDLKRTKDYEKILNSVNISDLVDLISTDSVSEPQNNSNSQYSHKSIPITENTVKNDNNSMRKRYLRESDAYLKYFKELKSVKNSQLEHNPKDSDGKGSSHQSEALKNGDHSDSHQRPQRSSFSEENASLTIEKNSEQQQNSQTEFRNPNNNYDKHLDPDNDPSFGNLLLLADVQYTGVVRVRAVATLPRNIKLSVDFQLLSIKGPMLIRLPSATTHARFDLSFLYFEELKFSISCHFQNDYMKSTLSKLMRKAVWYSLKASVLYPAFLSQALPNVTTSGRVVNYGFLPERNLKKLRHEIALLMTMEFVVFREKTGVSLKKSRYCVNNTQDRVFQLSIDIQNVMKSFDANNIDELESKGKDSVKKNYMLESMDLINNKVTYSEDARNWIKNGKNNRDRYRIRNTTGKKMLFTEDTKNKTDFEPRNHQYRIKNLSEIENGSMDGHEGIFNNYQRSNQDSETETYGKSKLRGNVRADTKSKSRDAPDTINENKLFYSKLNAQKKPLTGITQYEEFTDNKFMNPRKIHNKKKKKKSFIHQIKSIGKKFGIGKKTSKKPEKSEQEYDKEYLDEDMSSLDVEGNIPKDINSQKSSPERDKVLSNDESSLEIERGSSSEKYSEKSDSNSQNKDSYRTHNKNNEEHDAQNYLNTDSEDKIQITKNHHLREEPIEKSKECSFDRQDHHIPATCSLFAAQTTNESSQQTSKKSQPLKPESVTEDSDSGRYSECMDYSEPTGSQDGKKSVLDPINSDFSSCSNNISDFKNAVFDSNKNDDSEISLFDSKINTNAHFLTHKAAYNGISGSETTANINNFTLDADIHNSDTSNNNLKIENNTYFPNNYVLNTNIVNRSDKNIKSAVKEEMISQEKLDEKFSIRKSPQKPQSDCAGKKNAIECNTTGFTYIYSNPTNNTNHNFQTNKQKKSIVDTTSSETSIKTNQSQQFKEREPSSFEYMSSHSENESTSQKENQFSSRRIQNYFKTKYIDENLVRAFLCIFAKHLDIFKPIFQSFVRLETISENDIASKVKLVYEHNSYIFHRVWFDGALIFQSHESNEFFSFRVNKLQLLEIFFYTKNQDYTLGLKEGELIRSCIMEREFDALGAFFERRFQKSGNMSFEVPGLVDIGNVQNPYDYINDLHTHFTDEKLQRHKKTQENHLKAMSTTVSENNNNFSVILDLNSEVNFSNQDIESELGVISKFQLKKIELEIEQKVLLEYLENSPNSRHMTIMGFCSTTEVHSGEFIEYNIMSNNKLQTAICKRIDNTFIELVNLSVPLIYRITANKKHTNRRGSVLELYHKTNLDNSNFSIFLAALKQYERYAGFIQTMVHLESREINGKKFINDYPLENCTVLLEITNESNDPFHFFIYNKTKCTYIHEKLTIGFKKGYKNRFLFGVNDKSIIRIEMRKKEKGLNIKYNIHLNHNPIYRNDRLFDTHPRVAPSKKITLPLTNVFNYNMFWITESNITKPYFAEEKQSTNLQKSGCMQVSNDNCVFLLRNHGNAKENMYCYFYIGMWDL